MKNPLRLACVGAFVVSVALSSAAFAADTNSGFLGDYSKLSETKDANGDTVMRYINPKLTPGAYQKVMLDPTQFYPAPQPTDQVNASTLTEISSYVDNGLKTMLGAKVGLATAPGPGVLRVKPAITAVGEKKSALKPYQYIPIAFLVTSATGRSHDASIEIEVDVVDSVTGERMAASVRKGVGAKLADKNAALTLKDVQPLLDVWISTGTTFIASQMK